MDYLVDTNVLLRFAVRSDPRHQVVRNAVRRLREAEHTLRVAEQNLVELWNVATRPRERNGAGMTPERAERQLRLVERLFPRLPNADLYPEWRRLVARFGVSGVQVHDARLVAAMNLSGINHVLTFNTGDFRRYEDMGIIAVDPSSVAALGETE